MAWLNSRRKAKAAPDLEGFLADLRRGAAGGWTEVDRQRDFRAVFEGASTAEQGKRVLWQILEWARLWRTSAVKGDAHQTYLHEGERNIGLKILVTLNAEPRERPERAISTEPKE